MSLSISIFCYHVLPLHHSLEANIVNFIHFLYLIASVTSYFADTAKKQNKKKIDPSYCQ